MTDNLRTRTWRALEAHGLGWIDNGKPEIARCYCGYRPHLGESWHFHVADVLIRELGLQREERLGIWCSTGLTEPQHRYVTEWTADE